jgi:hypothetical protein
MIDTIAYTDKGCFLGRPRLRLAGSLSSFSFILNGFVFAELFFNFATGIVSREKRPLERFASRPLLFLSSLVDS